MTACGNPRSEAAPAAEWVRACPADAFCFSRPASLLRQPTQAIDSLTESYRSDSLSLVFDMGRYATSVDHLAGAAREAVQVDGRPGQMLIAEQEVVLLVPLVHQRGPIAVKFSMTLRFKDKAAPDLARRIFQSIEFKPPR